MSLDSQSHNLDGHGGEIYKESMDRSLAHLSEGERGLMRMRIDSAVSGVPLLLRKSFQIQLLGTMSGRKSYRDLVERLQDLAGSEQFKL